MGARCADWIKADKGVVFTFRRRTRNKAKIFSIQFLIFLDFGLGKMSKPVGPRFSQLSLFE